MISVLKGKDRERQSGLFEKLFRLRHKIFIKERGWSLPSKFGLEIDQYDVEEAIYFIELDKHENITSSVRLTPTLSHSLTADYFGHLVESSKNIRSNEIYEATRFIINASCKKQQRQSRIKLINAMTEWCVQNNVSCVQAVIDFSTLKSYVDINPDTYPLGLSMPYGGGRKTPGGGNCIAIHFPTTDKTLSSISEYEKTNLGSCIDFNCTSATDININHSLSNL